MLSESQESLECRSSPMQQQQTRGENNCPSVLTDGLINHEIDETLCLRVVLDCKSLQLKSPAH